MADRKPTSEGRCDCAVDTGGAVPLEENVVECDAHGGFVVSDDSDPAPEASGIPGHYAVRDSKVQ